MWIFCSSGFISIVEDRGDASSVLVRARLREHIEDLLPDLVSAIAHTPDADYHYRVPLPKADLAERVRRMVMEIDYDNFKNSINDEPYHQAALEAWSATRRLQSNM